MDIKLHRNATTTPRTRKYIQTSDRSNKELAEELNVSVNTIRRWRLRDDCQDKSHRPHSNRSKLTPSQAWLVIFLRQRLKLSLDELLEVTKLLINQNVSRAGVSRCLQRHGLARLKKSEASVSIGHVWFDAMRLPTAIAPHHVLLMITEKVTRYVSFALCDSLWPRESLEGIASYLNDALPYKIRSIQLSGQYEGAVHLALMVSSNISVISEAIQLAPDSAMFNMPLEQWLAGSCFDRRLSLAAVLLEYEAVLNEQVLRSRLNNMTPAVFLHTRAAV